MTWRSLVDEALELSVVGSFSRVGPAVRSRLLGWEALGAHRLDGQVAAVTGATSGLGRATAEGLAGLGASVVLLVRDVERGTRVAAAIRQATGATLTVVHVDMADLESVRTAAQELNRQSRIDVLIHNAGSLRATRRTTRQGLEETVAIHVIGPFLLTHLCMPGLLAATSSRIIVVTSGGMYTQPLDVDRLQMAPEEYDGVRAYARAKRAQVSIVEECAGPLARRGVHLLATHPGWADTPGLQQSLPQFRRFMRPLLRSAAEGADTTVWLASTPLPNLGAGHLWLDRRARSLHRGRSTARTDTAVARRQLVEECRRLAGLAAPLA